MSSNWHLSGHQYSSWEPVLDILLMSFVNHLVVASNHKFLVFKPLRHQGIECDEDANECAIIRWWFIRSSDRIKWRHFQLTTFEFNASIVERHSILTIDVEKQNWLNYFATTLITWISACKTLQLKRHYHI